MTNADFDDRLTRLESLVADALQLSLNTSDRVEQLQSLVTSTSNLVVNNSTRLDRLQNFMESQAVTVQNLLQVTQQMLDTQEQDRQEFEEFRTTTRETLASINAAVERIDRVMDYLMRRDGDRPSEG